MIFEFGKKNMVRLTRAQLAKTRLRYDFRGTMSDAAWYLLKDWKRFENPTPSNAACAHRLGLAPATVQYWINREDPPSMTPPPVPPAVVVKNKDSIRRRLVGIARETTIRTGEKFSRVRRSRSTRDVVTIKFPTISTVCREYNARTGDNMQPWTVRRHLKAVGFRSVKKARGPFLSVKGKAARVQFARDLLRQGIPKNIAFSDESKFDCNDHVGYQWVGPGQNPLVLHTTQGGETLLAWAVIGHNIRRLELFPGDTRLGSQQYVAMCLQPNLALLRHTTFQEDNARAHTAVHTQAWLAANNVTTLPNWPAFSPDLSPIENIWSILKREVSRRAPFGYDELRRFVREEFDNIPPSVINNLVASFEKRLRAVVRARGNQV
jgi:DDE superfamily endonuclease/Transposase